MQGDAWLSKIKLPINWTMSHIRQIVILCARSSAIHLQEDTDDDIIWKHTASGHYSATSAYKAQFHGTTRSPMTYAVWKPWAPPKVNFFT